VAKSIEGPIGSAAFTDSEDVRTDRILEGATRTEETGVGAPVSVRCRKAAEARAARAALAALDQWRLWPPQVALYARSPENL